MLGQCINTDWVFIGADCIVMLGAATFVHNWAPFSYVLLLVIMGTLVAAIYLMHTWPVRVDPENPMSKYNKEPPFEE